MRNILKRLIPKEGFGFNWFEHDSELKLGPFSFPPEVPVPYGRKDNLIACTPWLSVPFGERDPVNMKIDEESIFPCGEDLLKAYVAGHLSQTAPDTFRLVDHVGQCMLLVTALDSQHEHCDKVKGVIARLTGGARFFDHLVLLGREQIELGIRLSEDQQPSEAIIHFIISLTLQHGAFLISPTTPGVLYNLGLLCYDMAQRFSLPESADDDAWKRQFSYEAMYYLQMALSDKDIRSTTPAFFLLGVCREIIGELEEAESAYRRFLAEPAADSFPVMAEEAKKITDKIK